MFKKLWKFLDKYTSTVIVFISFLIVLIFTLVCIYLSVKGVSLSDILIEQFFKFYGYELIALSGIKIAKHVKRGGSDIEEELTETMDLLDLDPAEMSDIDE